MCHLNFAKKNCRCRLEIEQIYIEESAYLSLGLSFESAVVSRSLEATFLARTFLARSPVFLLRMPPFIGPPNLALLLRAPTCPPGRRMGPALRLPIYMIHILKVVFVNVCKRHYRNIMSGGGFVSKIFLLCIIGGSECNAISLAYLIGFGFFFFFWGVIVRKNKPFSSHEHNGRCEYLN